MELAGVSVTDRYRSAVCTYYNCGCGTFSHMHVKNLRTMCHDLCNLSVAIGWEVSLDSCRCVTGVSCAKVLHSMKRRY